MIHISDEIGRITGLLEDAIEERDWTVVQKCIDDLDVLYTQLDKQESGFGYEYE